MKHKPVDPIDDMMGQYQRFMKRESSKGTTIIFSIMRPSVNEFDSLQGNLASSRLSDTGKGKVGGRRRFGQKDGHMPGRQFLVCCNSP